MMNWDEFKYYFHTTQNKIQVYQKIVYETLTYILYSVIVNTIIRSARHYRE